MGTCTSALLTWADIAATTGRMPPAAACFSLLSALAARLRSAAARTSAAYGTGNDSGIGLWTVRAAAAHATHSFRWATLIQSKDSVAAAQGRSPKRGAGPGFYGTTHKSGFVVGTTLTWTRDAALTASSLSDCTALCTAWTSSFAPVYSPSSSMSAVISATGSSSSSSSSSNPSSNCRKGETNQGCRALSGRPARVKATLQLESAAATVVRRLEQPTCVPLPFGLIRLPCGEPLRGTLSLPDL